MAPTNTRGNDRRADNWSNDEGEPLDVRRIVIPEASPG
jgi:hypothetical protein